MATKKKTSSKRSSSGSDPKSKGIVRKKMKKTMHEFKHQELESGRSGKKVKNPKQAIAIGLSEARASPAPRFRKRAPRRAQRKRRVQQRNRLDGNLPQERALGADSLSSSRAEQRYDFLIRRGPFL
jgi:hypothetical protein